jgi:hypothetical protein
MAGSATLALAEQLQVQQQQQRQRLSQQASTKDNIDQHLLAGTSERR